MDNLGKQAELKIREWLDRPTQGFCFDRFPDQMNGFYGSKNPCDFLLFKSSQLYYIESKATFNNRFDFTMLTDYQHDSLLAKSQLDGVHGVVIVLFATQQRAFWIPIETIKALEDLGKRSINIDKIDKVKEQYEIYEIKTVRSRKALLDYDQNQDFPLHD